MALLTVRKTVTKPHFQFSMVFLSNHG